MSNIHREIPFLNRFLSSTYFVLAHAFPKSNLLESARKKNVSSIIEKLKNHGANEFHTLEVDRHDELSEQEFVKNYLNKGLPVIFTKAAQNWTCTKKWSLDYLKATYPDDEFSLIDSTGLVENDYDMSGGKDRPVLIDKIKASDFVDALARGDKTYLRFCPIMETHPELCDDLDHSWLKKYRRCFLGISYQTFIGPMKRKTPLHSETTAFFYIMADGEKKWTLYSPTALPLINPETEGRGYNYTKLNLDKPDATKYPGFQYLTRYTCHLKKGDILFVPAWMWHEVESLTNAWGVSYRFTSLRGFLKHPAFFIVRLFFSKPSFLEILYYSFFRSDIAKRKENLLTPKIYLKK